MGFDISGYVLEPIRVGQSNGPFTQTPDNYISNQSAFNAAYPSDESAPRTDYLVFVTAEGLLENARFGWTKNEVVDRFSYEGQAGSFKPLLGAAPVEVGVLSPEANTARLRVRQPVQVPPIAAAPYRIAVGQGSGTTFTIVIVVDDDRFTNSPTNPPSKSVQLSFATGNLNWNTGDLTTYSGQRVRFQQQQFYEAKDSTGRLGLPPVLPQDPPLILSPLPGPGQFPRLRFGYSDYLRTVEVPNESFTTPPVGTVQWARDTGRLNFNPTDVANHPGTAVYYDGVLFAHDLPLTPQPLGPISAPRNIAGLPPAGADLIFVPTGVQPYYRFPNVVYRPAAQFNAGKTGEVQVDPSNGRVKFSNADVGDFPPGTQVSVYFGDLLIERGISIRLLRNPVNLDGALLVKDVTEIYPVEGATWADPIIQSSQVSLPSRPMTTPSPGVQVIQGQGSFTSPSFPDLTLQPEYLGLGYYIDYDTATLYFAQRSEQDVPIQPGTSDVVLPDPLLLPGSVELVLLPGSTPLVLGDDALIDTLSGVVSLTSTHTLVVEGTASVSGTRLSDPRAQFLVRGVQAGFQAILGGEDVYTVASVLSETALDLDIAVSPPLTSTPYAIYDGREILADRYFDEVVLVDPSTKVERINELGTASNASRLSVPVAYVDSSGFRLGATQNDAFATVLHVDSFTSPPTGTVEINDTTGQLNFAAGDLGKAIYWARELEPKVDYELQPELGLVQFRERLFAGEEARITYTMASPSTIPPTPPGAPITEYARFLIRKEITAPHPSPTSTLTFNPDKLPVASVPSPAVFRGGRPQQLGVQCVVDTERSQITFLADSQITDALPHGATIGPTERVYIDYYVTQAVGGEKTFTVLQPPILTSVVEIREFNEVGENNNQFVVAGDQTARFPTNYLMRIENQQVYLLEGSTYDPAKKETTITLDGEQVFQDPFTDPKIDVSSGPTPNTTAPLVPAYFTPELGDFEPIARGSNTFLIPSDLTGLYRTGTIVLFTGTDYTDYLQVSGASYDPATDRTTVMLTANALQEYEKGPAQLSRTVRPIYEPPLTEVQTSLMPKLTQPHVVYRRVADQPGQALTSPDQYTINDSGHIVFAEPLGPLEEFSIFYTGLTTMGAGQSLHASYASQVTPSATNGLLGQTLLANYSIRSPDTFYFRVETMTNFRGEYAAEIKQAASSGSSGPITSNASQPELWEQGRKSLYFDERHLANQDVIARSTLLFYNELTNGIEQYRRHVDGTVVGNNDGPFVYDGTTGTVRIPPEPAENQIDDAVKVSPAPYKVTFAPFAVTSIGTYRKYYLPGSLSRFYPTSKDFFGITTDVSAAETGDEVLDTGSTNITQVSNLRTRQPWGVLTEDSQFSGKGPSGGQALRVDFASGNEPGFEGQVETYARVAFQVGMKCLIVARDGTMITPADSPVTVTDVSNHVVSISGSPSGNIPVGSTIYQSPADDSGNMTHFQFSRDYSFNGESGQVTFVAPTVPPAIPPPIPREPNTPLPGLTPISGSLTLVNSLTEPFRFPALFGGIEDDDGELSFPIQSPDPKSELNGYLATESELIATGSGLLRTLTAPLVSTGSVVAPNFSTIVDPRIGPPMNPVQPHMVDLVRILDGPLSVSDPEFRRILSTGNGFLTVTVPFSGPGSNFRYELAVSPTLAFGFTTGGNASQMEDTAGTFLSTARVGYTVVVMTPLPSAVFYRRQIVEVVSDTMISFAPPLPFSVTAGLSYRFENSLATYGVPAGAGAERDYLQLWDQALAGEQAMYPAQQEALLAAIEPALTDVTVGSGGQTTAGQQTLRDSAATFLTKKVTSGQCVYILDGPNAGIYEIDRVVSETELTATTTFPVSLSGISYRIVSLFGLTFESVTALFESYQSVAALMAPLAPLRARLARVPVRDADGANTFAVGVLKEDLDTRELQVNSRQSGIDAILSAITDILQNVEKLYDNRYVWIDTRINLQDGLLVQQDTAIKNRIKAQADIVKQLTKLLAVESA